MTWPGHIHGIIYFYPPKQGGCIQTADWERLLALANPQAMPGNCLWQHELAEAEGEAEPVLTI